MAKNVHKMMTKQFVKKIVPLDLIPDLSGIPPFHGAVILKIMTFPCGGNII